MKDLTGKKLLILAGASVHCKLVRAAKELGVYTIVTDYLAPEQSPAKLLADEYWMLNVTDVEGIVERCRRENVDGIIAGWIDVCQMSYCQICKELALPCYGTEEQFYQLTNKHAFKRLCVSSGVDVIPEYSKEDVKKGCIVFPVFVKPVDSRGSRGQAICNNMEELLDAMAAAEIESSNGDILIEKYIANRNSFQVTYLFVDGIPYLIRTTDGYKGCVTDKMDKVAICSVSPSIYTEDFMQNAHEKIVAMMRSIGFRNGPVMLQGFYDDGIYRFYDPGLRFPGVDFDIVYKKEKSIDVMQLMVEFALTGAMDSEAMVNADARLNGKVAAVLFPTITAGKIASIEGVDNIKGWPNVYSFTLRHKVGEEVGWTFNVNQRIAEINVLADNKAELTKIIQDTYTNFIVRDEDGKSMLFSPFYSNQLI